VVDGTSASAQHTVNSGGTLNGTGDIGPVSVNSGGTLAPGTSPDCIDTGDLAFASGGILLVDLAGTVPCTAHDQVRVTGTVGLGSATLMVNLAYSRRLFFNPGAPSTQEFRVRIRGDSVAEPTETFFVNIRSVRNAAIGRTQGVGTIIDTDPIVSISDAEVDEGNIGSNTNAVLTVSLSHLSTLPVRLTYEGSTSDGTATAGRDYVAIRRRTLTFRPGEVTKTITVRILGDREVERDEYFRVLVSATGSLTHPDAVARVTIRDDDGAVDAAVAARSGRTAPSQAAAAVDHALGELLRDEFGERHRPAVGFHSVRRVTR
jgi:hypothetical protein